MKTENESLVDGNRSTIDFKSSNYIRYEFFFFNV